MSGKVVALPRGASDVDRLDGARRALAQAEALPDVARIVDYAEAAKVAAKRAGLAEESQRSWATFSLEAQRKAGELLRDMPKNAGRRPASGRAGQPQPPKLRNVLDTKTDQEAKDRSANWQKVANVPEAAFADYVKNAEEPTRAGLLSHADAAAIAREAADGAESVRTARFVSGFSKQVARAAAIASEYDPAEIARLLDDDGLRGLQLTAASLDRFAQRVTDLRDEKAGPL